MPKRPRPTRNKPKPQDIDIAAIFRIAAKEKANEKHALAELRQDFRIQLTSEVANMANSLNPEWREPARKMLGVADSAFDPETEDRISMISRAMDGDEKAICQCAKVVSGSEDVPESLKRSAIQLTIAGRIADHAKGKKDQDEKSMMEALSDLEPETAKKIKKELEQVYRASPYESVKEMAGYILEKIEE